MENEILNTGLSLALEFGPDWLKPIQERLTKRYPNLSAKELDDCEALCRKVRENSNQHFLTLLKKTPDENVLRDSHRSYLLENYPWIGEKNLGSLVSQAFYYAMK